MTTERKGVLAFGELLWDVFPGGAHIGGAPFHLAAHAVRCGLTAQLLSRVGAGDAFSAAFLAFWLRGRSPIEAATVANELGAFVASQRGAVPDYTDAIRQRLA